MKKIFSLLCCFGIVLSSLLFGGMIFCSNIASHSLIDIAVDQSHLEEQLRATLNDIDVLHTQSNTDYIQKIVDEMMKDDEILAEMDQLTNQLITDLVNDETSEITSDLNQVIKQKLISYASEISKFTNLPEQDISLLLSERVDNMNVQGVYEELIMQMKEQFSPTQKLLLKWVSFLQSDLSYYGSLFAMILFSILLLVLDFAWLNGLIQIAVSWLISAIVMFVISKIAPFVFTLIFSNDSLIEGLNTNVDKLSKLSAIYFVIFIVCTMIKVIYNHIFIKD